ncbi:hypothetical protein QKW60_05720 [Defluviimonas aestuarii]|uniref:hypothetical protein n=1 Tax=Albidovulum aestuarii TaxID=1130726 RepID=UPI00249A0F88|nr:hypothetical protein [Defluviimonas aestuarii]MDI3335895.1 hypothetical protein [Defluviimonas aestuarii]
MPRITFTARPINAPQASRKGGRRTLRDNKGPEKMAGHARGLGTPPRSTLPHGAAFIFIIPFAVVFWTGILHWAVGKMFP